MCHKLHIQPGDTTADGRLTLEFAECLGACEHAPCMLAGERLYKNLDQDAADKFLQGMSRAERSSG
jgi:NADH-quinone oxidoreductase subunit E